MPKFQKITKKYGNRSIFDCFDLSLADGKVSVIMGASGAGKTTLLNILSGLIRYEGQIEVNEPISYLFQSDRLIKHLTVRENLKFVLIGKYRTQSDELISDMLKKVGLEDKADCFPTELSGGEKKRAAIARAFVYPSETLLLDEPFSSLDYALKLQLMELLADLLHSSSKTTVFVTHDPDEALALADDIYVLGQNRIIYKKSLSSSEGLRDITGNEANSVRKEIYAVLSGLNN